MLRGSEKRQERVTMAIGAAALLCIALTIGVVIVKPFSGRPKDLFSLAITTPYVGQGVAAGTPVVLHGVKVGQVIDVTNSAAAAGGVHLVTELQTQPTQGLTDAVNIDFRPINYFGVPGINLRPNPGGRALYEGVEINVVPTGNFTLSELLNQLGDVSASSLTPQFISVVDRVTRYTDGLNPLFETAVTVARAVKAVQTVPTEQLLTNLSTAIASFPAFTDEAVVTGTRTHKFDYYPGQRVDPSASSVPKLDFPYLQDTTTPNMGDFSEDYFQQHFIVTFDFVRDGLFSAVGRLVSSHVGDLLPLVSGIQTITDTGPVLLRPQDIASKLAELRSRFEMLYAGNGDQRAVNVRILLDSLPGVAAPIGIVTGGTP